MIKGKIEKKIEKYKREQRDLNLAYNGAIQALEHLLDEDEEKKEKKKEDIKDGK